MYKSLRAFGEMGVIKDDKKIDPRKAKLKQRLAVIEQQKLAVSYKTKLSIQRLIEQSFKHFQLINFEPKI